jgi:hypothetical protein
MFFFAARRATPNLNLASLHHKEFKVCFFVVCFSSHLAQRQGSQNPEDWLV